MSCYCGLVHWQSWVSQYFSIPCCFTLVNPYWSIQFILHHPTIAFITLGAVVLTITGGEALYADIGILVETY